MAPAPPAWQVQPGFLPGAIAAMVLGIVALWMFPLGVLLGPLAIGFAVYAHRRHRANPMLRGRGMATAGLVTGIVGLMLGAGFVAIIVFAAVLDSEPEEDRGADITAVQGGMLSRNMDADSARELVVAVAAWDLEHDHPLEFAGRIEVVVQSSHDGETWEPVANRSIDVEPQWRGLAYSPSVAYIEFEEIELDRSAWYRARVVVAVEATGAVFEDETLPLAGSQMPERFDL